MKKICIILLLLISALGYSQPRYYVCLAPNVAFDSPANDFNNLMGVNLEVGKYINTTALGITTGYYSLDSKYLFSELIATVPIVTDFFHYFLVAGFLATGFLAGAFLAGAFLVVLLTGCGSFLN